MLEQMLKYVPTTEEVQSLDVIKDQVCDDFFYYL